MDKLFRICGQLQDVRHLFRTSNESKTNNRRINRKKMYEITCRDKVWSNLKFNNVTNSNSRNPGHIVRKPFISGFFPIKSRSNDQKTCSRKRSNVYSKNNANGKNNDTRVAKAKKSSRSAGPPYRSILKIRQTSCGQTNLRAKKRSLCLN